MKIAEAVLIMTFTIFSVNTYFNKKKRELKILSEFIEILDELIIMLSNTAPSTDEMLISISSKNEREEFTLNSFDDFKIFDKYINEKIGACYDMLGKYDADTQLTFFRESREFFKAIRKKYEAALERNRKTYYPLSLSVGFAICLIII